MSTRSRAVTLFAVLGLLAGSVVLVTAAPATATTVAVTVTSSVEGGGTCPSPTDCTLRQAMADATAGGPNENSDAVITVAGGLGTIDLLGTLDYDGGAGGTHSLVFNGNGVTLTGNDTFALVALDTSGTVSVSGATFSHGASGTGGAIASTGSLTVANSRFIDNNSSTLGGAVFVVGESDFTNVEFATNRSASSAGALYTNAPTTLDNVTFTGNAAGVNGGALLTTNGLTIRNSTFNDNVAAQYGGAILNTSTPPTTVTNSTFDGNSTTTSGGGGGAIVLVGPLTVVDSKFTNNSGSYGGAIYGASTLTVSGSRFAHNSADDGGAIIDPEGASISTSWFDFNTSFENGGAVTIGTDLDLSSSTFTNNTSRNGEGAFHVVGNAQVRNSTFDANDGGGLASTMSAASLSIAYSTSTDLAAAGSQTAISAITSLTLFGNVLTLSSTATGAICNGPAITHGYNYADDSSCALTAPGDVQDGTIADARLDPLANNGGVTPTRLPLATSPLIDAIPSTACHSAIAVGVTTDQRGFARPDFVGGPCDIGAVQFTPMVSTSLIGTTVVVRVSEFTTTATITVHSEPVDLGTIAIDAAGSGTATFEIPCSIGNGPHTITATASGGQIASSTIELTICEPIAVPTFTG